MTTQQFRQSMMAGLGRCYLQLQSGDKEVYRPVVLEGCLTNFSYDTQANGTAEHYVYGLVCCYDDPCSFLPPLVAKYRALDFACTNDWDILYYTRLITLFALDGATEAAEVIRERYQQMLTVLLDPDRAVEDCVDYDEEVYSMLGTALLTIDGTAAYLRIAADMNRLHRMCHIRCYDLPWLVSAINELPASPDFVQYVTRYATEDVSAFLADYAVARLNVYGGYEDEEDAFEDTVDEDADKAPETDPSREVDASLCPVTFRPFYSWAEGCEDPAVWAQYPDVKARLSEGGARAGRILRRLRQYEDCPCDMPLSPLLRYVNDCDRYVRHAAEELFASRSDSEAVAYAAQRLVVAGPEWWTLAALIAGYRPDNEQLILYMMHKLSFAPEDLDHWHALVYAIVDVVLDRHVALPADILIYAYERSLCRNCREQILRILYDKGWLTPAMQEECYFDANEDIVAFARAHHFAGEPTVD